MTVLGFDTSNYTSPRLPLSTAPREKTNPASCRSRRGSWACVRRTLLFAHVKSLPDLAGGLFSHVDPQSVAAVGVSTRPRAVDGSLYALFSGRSVPGQDGGLPPPGSLGGGLSPTGASGCGPVVFGPGGAVDRPFLAWHLSGGTTELLYVEPQGRNVACSRIGGTTDISAGQLIDRTGRLLGLPFPAGKALTS
ncbi:MAG: hypothetical protein ACLU9S_08840 [Oscillospiraceae bacterium]